MATGLQILAFIRNKPDQAGWLESGTHIALLRDPSHLLHGAMQTVVQLKPIMMVMEKQILLYLILIQANGMFYIVTILVTASIGATHTLCSLLVIWMAILHMNLLIMIHGQRLLLTIIGI